ncbi:hypothetical protein MWU58_00100 [Flavobacteriaceae bacterium S0825]|uniref:hypothetical protein n=1 Tax=Gaetbulibacter sp. S0825 TaxID=2720084 RepID=UPI00142FB16F|nr:hypothetical protein [Gaetbulibacter sp. S0825]MCK0107681.1 hypothetical protein [Flavobacteriaceae bacterium S0825]NIX63317.1 hypothetical protein [Gaetbulibacter sp. S0825]
MKKIILIAIALVSLQGIAQERQREQRKDFKKQRSQALKDLTPEQAATLQTKKMTLHLDLSEAQQKDIYKLNFANAKERQAKMKAAEKMRESGEKPSKEARYGLMNERLDKQIAQKKQIKSILTKEQFEKFEKGSKQKKMKQRKQQKQRGKSKQRFKKS